MQIWDCNELVESQASPKWTVVGCPKIQDYFLILHKIHESVAAANVELWKIVCCCCVYLSHLPKSKLRLLLISDRLY